ncbi:Protein of unknown function [Nocardioides scoriae]|uniref:DUF3071 domain-containing protein n=1 Tax=Nocardioides scoriae TaxID=642780 RepID=A0A1H1Q6M3_9ACTN|nr:septation protein SepH [Nocardioides scoriae]SDS19075.1 Protein of unknown function [Nocardioides scoriae]
MQHLTPTGRSEDGSRLILVSDSGEEYAVDVDARLREVLRDRPAGAPSTSRAARTGQKQENTMDSALRPRDIQARIRAGESAEQVAQAAGTPVETIMPYASPVLAERAHVAYTALKASVRRPGGPTGGARTLGEAVEQFLAEHRLHDDDVEWDAWRRPDGRWALTADVTVAGRDRHAELTADLPGRYVLAENDDARLLTGELVEDRGTGAVAAAPRRLTALRPGEDLPLGDDAIELVRDREEPSSTAEAFDPGADTADADWIADGAAPVEEPTSAPAHEDGLDDAGHDHADERDPDLEDTVAVPRTDDGPHDEQPEADDEPVVPAADPEVVDAELEARSGPEPDQDELDLGVPPQSAEEKQRTARRKRASVPSWDEIMFGGGGSDS